MKPAGRRPRPPRRVDMMKVRAQLGDLVDRARLRGETFALTRRGRVVAYILGPEAWDATSRRSPRETRDA